MLLVFVVGFAGLVGEVWGQVYSDKVVGERNAGLSDSLKNTSYPYALPIWGKKATELGFELPYSAGINVNYLWQESEIVINNLYVGFNHGPQYDLDEIVRFTNTTSSTSAVNMRPDIWLLPFLNVYGIFARSGSSTDVNFGVWVPDSTDTWEEVFSSSAQASFNGTTIGFGLTPTIGVGGGFIALDMNFAWTDIEELEKPAFSFVFGPRFGKSFRLKKEQTLAVWVGGFRVKINSGTKGSLPVADLLDTEDLEERIAGGIIKVGEAQTEVDIWWGNLTPPQQNNPVNKAKYETANRALESAGNFLSAAAVAVDNLEQSTIQYSLDKQQKDLWNFVVGGQFQFNKHLMARAEVGFLSSRKQVLCGLQYRFGL
ncbi:MAG TPA: hypothetical protein VKZ75_08805 [Cyclobacteriaceae bacterium]|nr:hypothetical protein [Cyclobacteriaceae bacterium]